MKRERGGWGGRRGTFFSERVNSGRRKCNISNNQNKRQGLKSYLHGTGPDQQMAMFTKVKNYLILNIKSEFVIGSDIAE